MYVCTGIKRTVVVVRLLCDCMRGDMAAATDKRKAYACCCCCSCDINQTYDYALHYTVPLSPTPASEGSVAGTDDKMMAVRVLSFSSSSLRFSAIALSRRSQARLLHALRNRISSRTSAYTLYLHQFNPQIRFQRNT
jgi:hypothetical protein